MTRRWTPQIMDLVAVSANSLTKEYVFGYVQAYRDTSCDIFLLDIEAYGVLKAAQLYDQTLHRSDLSVRPERLMRAVWTVLGPVAVLASRHTVDRPREAV